MRYSVGIIIISRSTNNFLLLHRAKDPIVWSSLSGKMDEGEKDPLVTLKREITEEIGVDSNMIDNITFCGAVDTKNKKHYVYIGFVDDDFSIPNLKLDENDSYGWFNEETIPTPIHKRWSSTFDLIKPFLDVRKKIVEWTRTHLR